MAIRIPNQNPLDLNNNVAVGVAIPFNQPAVFRSTFTTVDQTKSNIINYILTNKGERIFNLNFGSNIRTQLFNNSTPQTVSNIQQTLQSELEVNFPQVKIQSLTVTPSYDVNTIDITIVYSIYNGEPETIQITT
jgi:phage baseplate assembly protein W